MGVIGKSELLESLYKIGEGKASYKLYKMLVLAFLAGLFIALSGLSYVVVNTGMASLNATYGKFISGICFSFGLFAVVVAGADLFTGNVLMLAPALGKRITFPKMFRNWVFVYLFNFVGAIFVSLIVYFASIMTPEMLAFLHKITVAKTTESFTVLLFKGIGCNIFVCLGVWMAYACKDGVSKFFACAISVILFLICGFEHSIANMFYLSYSFIISDISAGAVIYDLIPVTIGNIIGGSIVAISYYLAYKE